MNSQPNKPKIFKKDSKSNHRTRTLIYRRAIWDKDAKALLENRLLECHKLLKTTEDRTFPHNRGQIQCLEANEKDKGGIRLHLSFCKPDMPTSTVPKPSSDFKQETGILAPPQGSDFMEGDVMIYIKGNDVVICASNTNEAVLGAYLDELFSKCKKDAWAIALSLTKVANIDKIKLLNQEGAKYIHLGASLFKATLDEESEKVESKKQKSMWANISETLTEQIKALLKEEKGIDFEELEKESALNVKLLLSYNSRKKENAVSQHSIESIAKKIIDDDEDTFIIETSKGKKVKPNEIVISKRVSLSLSGNSVDLKETWRELEAFYESLRIDGFLLK